MNTIVNLIEATNICKSYPGVQALNHVNFSVKPGEIVCLVGENGCGKSTLIRMITGVEPFEEGELVLNGKAAPKGYSLSDALKEGIQVIYQDLALFSHMTVAENIAMNYLVSKNIHVMGKKEMRQIARSVMDKINVDLPMDTPINEISIANRQMVAICRALTLDARLLFMDEPTTALTKSEVEQLLRVVMDLKKKNYSIVFVSHKLDEVFEIADRITVLRDGNLIGNFKPEELNQKKLAYYMTGSEVIYKKYERNNTDDTPVLELRGLTKKGNYQNIDLTIRKGDIYGLAGLLGSGRTELALSLFGLNPPSKGEILFKGKRLNIRKPKDAIDAGIGLVPEDRAEQGLFLKSSVSKNLVSVIIDRLKENGRYSRRQEKNIASGMKNRMNIKAPSIDFQVQNLSGGNQQKVSIGKWISTQPLLLILDSPTVGIDIGSKADIYARLQEFAATGMSILLISDEIEELVSNCNSIAVMSSGRIIKVYDEKDLKGEQIRTELAELIESSYSNCTQNTKGA